MNLASLPPPPARVIEGAYLRDVLAQPAVLEGLISSLAQQAVPGDLAAGLRAGRFQRVVLTGMGSSWHALYPLHLKLNGAGFVSHWLEASELLLGFKALWSPDTLLIAVSQSGESAEIVRLLERASEFGHIIGVTNHAASSLGRLAGTTFLMHAGPEATVSCKTYLATLAVMHWLGTALTGGDAGVAAEELADAARTVRDYLKNWRQHVAAFGELVPEVQCVFVTGRGVSLATTGTGGLILKESTRRPAEGMSCAAFRHGPFELVGDHVLVLVFAGDARTAGLHRRLAEEIARAGGRVAFLTDEAATPAAFRLAEVPDALRPLLEILPVQMLSLAIAARDGREAGRFERASKITTAE